MGILGIFKSQRWIKQHKKEFIEAYEGNDKEKFEKLRREGIDVVLFDGAFNKNQKKAFELNIAEESDGFYQQMNDAFMNGLQGDGKRLSIALGDVNREAEKLANFIIKLASGEL